MNSPVLNIQILRGEQVEHLLAAAPASSPTPFAAQWSALLAQCPWATAFQTPAYVTAWYQTYRSRYEPLLLIGQTDQGQLQGLLPLAVRVEDGQCVVAGDNQAGYQVWVCPGELAEAFPPAAMDELQRLLPSCSVQFRYLPPGVPLEWLKRTEFSHRSLLETHRRPLLRFGDGSDLENSLKKGSNRSRLNRLQKLGAMEFKHITDPAELESRFAEIVSCHDTRHVAVNGAASFSEDPLMKSFALAIASAPGLIHATILTVGGRLASAHLGACSGKEVELGLITHNPWMAKHSPGKFHVYFLARMLREQGFERLDLTPGGGAHYYKERFANAYDEVHTLTLYAGALQRRVGAAGAVAKAATRKALDLLHLTPNQARLYARRLARVRPSTIAMALGRAANWLSSSRRLSVYRRELNKTLPPVADDAVHRDCLDDLLSYRPADAGPSRQEFMAAVLERIEDGQHLYTLVQGGKLLHWAWLIERPDEAAVARHLAGFPLGTDTALALDFHSQTPSEHRDLAAAFLPAMLRDSAAARGIRQLTIALPVVDDGPLSPQALQQMGFVFDGTVLQRRRLGMRRRQAQPIHAQAAATSTSKPSKPANTSNTSKTSKSAKTAESPGGRPGRTTPPGDDTDSQQPDRARGSRRRALTRSDHE